VTAGLVSAGAGDAAAIFGHRAFARAHKQVALAHAYAILGTTHAAQAVAQHFAKVLQRGAGHLVGTTTRHFHAAFALFELDRATRRHRHVGYAGQNAGQHSRHGHGRAGHSAHHHGGTFSSLHYHWSNSFWEA
jgi:hypothetical protein